MLTVIAPPGSLADAVGQALRGMLPAEIADVSAIIDALPPVRTAAVDQLADDDFEAGLVRPLADLAAGLAALVPARRRIVLIGSAAFLGDWDSALAGGLAAGVVGLLRSVALEFAAEAVTINMIAVASPDAARAADVATLASALLQGSGVNGQVIACDGGDNLRMSRARQRRPALPDDPAKP